jgi:hypothetical protein
VRHARAEPARPKWLWARPTVPDPWAEAGPTLCGGFFDFFVFLYILESWYKLQNLVENKMKLRKIQNKLL